MHYEPFTDQDLEQLESLLGGADNAMNPEQIYGLFTALICGPSIIPLSRCWTLITGADRVFENVAQAQALTGLLIKMWNEIAGTLHNKEVYLPLLLLEEDAPASGQDWASGFKHGMELDRTGWTPLWEDETQAGYLVPIMALAHLDDPDPSLRPWKGDEITEERLEACLTGAVAGVVKIYAYFEPYRRQLVQQATKQPGSYRATSARNAPCACGSGKKYKHCCARAKYN